MAEYSSLKVPELKKLLSEKGLPQTGNKADLVARLTEHDKSAGDAAPAAAPAAKKGTSAILRAHHSSPIRSHANSPRR